jgi:uncharacterized membrane protein
MYLVRKWQYNALITFFLPLVLMAIYAFIRFTHNDEMEPQTIVRLCISALLTVAIVFFTITVEAVESLKSSAETATSFLNLIISIGFSMTLIVFYSIYSFVPPAEDKLYIVIVSICLSYLIALVSGTTMMSRIEKAKAIYS